jgi:mRNA interferase RelE/StbE
VSAPGKPEPYEVVVPGPVRRAISEKLPEGVAWAVIEFINGPLARNPHRVGIEFAGT